MWLADIKDGQVYTVTGKTSALVKYSGKAILVEGKVDGSTKPWPTFQVLRLDQVFDRPNPGPKASFSDRSTWRAETNRIYGVQSTHPKELTKSSESYASMMRANFADDTNVVTVSMLQMPGEVYPETNFGYGTFAIFVDPEIGNARSCSVFGDSEPRFLSPYRVGDVQYTRMKEVGGAMGMIYKGETFHTFQNGLCYEISFRLAEDQTGNVDTGCLIPMMRDQDDMKLIQPLLETVSFLRPLTSLVRNKPKKAAPRITKFEASSKTAEKASLGQVTFTWSTDHADYVEFSYSCDPPPSGPVVVILEGLNQRECENAKPRLYEGSFGRPADASQTITFGNSNETDPITVTVKITPFSYGRPYPGSSKWIAIEVEPFNRSSKGKAAATRTPVVH